MESDVEGVTVNVTSTSASRISIGSVTFRPRTISETIPVVEGPNILNIVASASDGVTESNYRVIVHRKYQIQPTIEGDEETGGNALLESLECVSDEIFATPFDPLNPFRDCGSVSDRLNFGSFWLSICSEIGTSRDCRCRLRPSR